MTINNDKNIFTNLKILIEALHEVGFITHFLRKYIIGYVRALSYLRYKLKKIIKSDVSEFDDQFYSSLFKFDYKEKDHESVSQNDPFYPLLEHVKKLLADLILLREAYDAYFHKEKTHNTAFLIYVSIVEHRKEFMKDVIDLMCSQYTIKIKGIETSVDLENESKVAIDELFKTAIKRHHRIFFKTLDNNVKTTNDYAKMYEYLQIIKNPVNESCSRFTERFVRNETQEILLGQFVQECKALKKKFYDLTNETSLYLPESNNFNVQLSFYKSNRFVIQESSDYLTNTDSKGSLTNPPVILLVFLMFIVILFKRLIWQ